MLHRMFLGAALLFTCPLSAAEFETRLDVEFSSPGGESLKLDAYLLRDPARHPALIFVHGGGFVGGDKKEYPRDLLEPLMEIGFSTFSINYRLSPKHPFPAAVDDVESAVRYLKQHAADFRIDPERLALLGPSAGGLLVSWAGAACRPENRVAAVVSMFGEHDLVLRAAEDPCSVDGRAIPRPKGGCISGGLAAFLGFSELTPENEPKLRQASAVTHVHRDMPPYLLIHGTRDFGVPFEQSVSMQEAMRNAGADCTLIPIVGGGHGGWNKPEMQHYRRELREWLKEKLRVGA
jgi:alpha-L-fucosidase 2